MYNGVRIIEKKKKKKKKPHPSEEVAWGEGWKESSSSLLLIYIPSEYRTTSGVLNSVNLGLS